jgi:hypothetical protein
MSDPASGGSAPRPTRAPTGRGAAPTPTASTSDAPTDADRARDRRRNLALRALIDEMLGKVREAHRQNTLWGPGEREQAERELAEIMARVRAEALARRSAEGRPAAGPASGSTGPDDEA